MPLLELSQTNLSGTIPYAIDRFMMNNRFPDSSFAIDGKKYVVFHLRNGIFVAFGKDQETEWSFAAAHKGQFLEKARIAPVRTRVGISANPVSMPKKKESENAVFHAMEKTFENEAENRNVMDEYPEMAEKSQDYPPRPLATAITVKTGGIDGQIRIGDDFFMISGGKIKSNDGARASAWMKDEGRLAIFTLEEDGEPVSFMASTANGTISGTIRDGKFEKRKNETENILSGEFSVIYDQVSFYLYNKRPRIDENDNSIFQIAEGNLVVSGWGKERTWNFVVNEKYENRAFSRNLDLKIEYPDGSRESVRDLAIKKQVPPSISVCHMEPGWIPEIDIRDKETVISDNCGMNEPECAAGYSEYPAEENGGEYPNAATANEKNNETKNIDDQTETIAAASAKETVLPGETGNGGNTGILQTGQKYPSESVEKSAGKKNATENGNEIKAADIEDTVPLKNEIALVETETAFSLAEPGKAEVEKEPVSDLSLPKNTKTGTNSVTIDLGGLSGRIILGNSPENSIILSLNADGTSFCECGEIAETSPLLHIWNANGAFDGESWTFSCQWEAESGILPVKIPLTVATSDGEAASAFMILENGGDLEQLTKNVETASRETDNPGKILSSGYFVIEMDRGVMTIGECVFRLADAALPLRKGQIVSKDFTLSGLDIEKDGDSWRVSYSFSGGNGEKPFIPLKFMDEGGIMHAIMAPGNNGTPILMEMPPENIFPTACGKFRALKGDEGTVFTAVGGHCGTPFSQGSRFVFQEGELNIYHMGQGEYIYEFEPSANFRGKSLVKNTRLAIRDSSGDEAEISLNIVIP